MYPRVVASGVVFFFRIRTAVGVDERRTPIPSSCGCLCSSFFMLFDAKLLCEQADSADAIDPVAYSPSH